MKQIPDLRFRDAVRGDLSAIVDIYNSTIAGRMVTADTSPVEISSKEPWFYSHDPATRPLLIIENEQGALIGWMSFADFYGRPAYSGTAEISIYLAEDMRGKGHGKAILKHAVLLAPSLRIHTLLGYIFAHNQPSIQLFLTSGFREWAHLEEVALMDEKYYSLKIFGRKI